MMIKNKKKYFFIFLTLILSSCTFAGIQHYYKSNNVLWKDKGGKTYHIKNSGPIMNESGQESFLFNSIYSTTNISESYLTFGIFYLSIIPDFFHIFNDYNRNFFIIFKLDVDPSNSKIKLNDIKIYFNGDSVETTPNEINVDTTSNQFLYGYNINESKIESVCVKFADISINGSRVSIPDLVLKRKWRFFNTMDWAR